MPILSLHLASIIMIQIDACCTCFMGELNVCVQYCLWWASCRSHNLGKDSIMFLWCHITLILHKCSSCMYFQPCNKYLLLIVLIVSLFPQGTSFSSPYTVWRNILYNNYNYNRHACMWIKYYIHKHMHHVSSHIDKLIYINACSYYSNFHFVGWDYCCDNGA